MQSSESVQRSHAGAGANSPVPPRPAPQGNGQQPSVAPIPRPINQQVPPATGAHNVPPAMPPAGQNAVPQRGSGSAGNYQNPQQVAPTQSAQPSWAPAAQAGMPSGQPIARQPVQPFPETPLENANAQGTGKKGKDKAIAGLYVPQGVHHPKRSNRTGMIVLVSLLVLILGLSLFLFLPGAEERMAFFFPKEDTQQVSANLPGQETDIERTDTSSLNSQEPDAHVWVELTPIPTATLEPITPEPSDAGAGIGATDGNPEETSLPEGSERPKVTANPAMGDRVCYMTFDDGPSKLTESILEILRKHDVKATFFMLGESVARHPEKVRLIYDEGHALANHSYTHEYKKIYASSSALLEEIRQTEDAIQAAIGPDYESTRLFRFPGGSTGSAKKYREKINEWGFRWYDWNVLNGDSQLKGEKTPERLYDFMVETYNNARKSEVIVLMHDTNSKQATVDMLDRALTFFEEEGYQFDTLDHIPDPSE